MLALHSVRGFILQRCLAHHVPGTINCAPAPGLLSSACHARASGGETPVNFMRIVRKFNCAHLLRQFFLEKVSFFRYVSVLGVKIISLQFLLCREKILFLLILIPIGNCGDTLLIFPLWLLLSDHVPAGTLRFYYIYSFMIGGIIIMLKTFAPHPPLAVLPYLLHSKVVSDGLANFISDNSFRIIRKNLVRKVVGGWSDCVYGASSSW